MIKVGEARHGLRRLVIGASAAALAVTMVAACGSSANDDSSSTTTAAGSSSGPLKLDEPVTIGMLWEVKGESQYGIDAYNQGANLAIKEINAAGGIGGQKVKSFRIAASPVDTQNTVSAMVEAQGKSPTAIVGLASPTQVAAVSSNLERSPIPVIATTNSSPDFVFGSAGGHDNLWTSGTYDPSIAATGVDFLVKKQGAKKIGVLATNESYGNGGVKTVKAELEKNGLEPYAVAQFAPDATDLTPQVLKMKGADAVIVWSYPGPLGVALKQMKQNDIDVPIVSSTSGLTVLGQKTVTVDETKKFYLALPCDALSTDYSKTLTSFADRFKAAYGVGFGSPPAAWAYDSVKAIDAAVEKAKSTDPDAVNAAMASIKVSDGSGCGGPVQPDAGHVMTHDVVVSKVSADGTSKVIQNVTTDPVPKGG